ncbi:NitT/TauT family transport system ATP-binding protein [Herbaspirillum sp. Sphag1AN]|nr:MULTISPECIES: ABC transporter ATP-binding protein [unclassified Herbaspirillum]MBB3211062.1 NitT/TauT family transport system ATP-binding protein [Herbaspirillum sp. Sphag1AN]MBB3244691.1 NitT/TauT family transport system ATP-binding protein [Herbaspirillum sp. Sphag64]
MMGQTMMIRNLQAVVNDHSVQDNQPAAGAICVRNVLKRYPGKHAMNALEDVSLTIREREFVSILGPSGCGKSTLLRIVAGLVPHNAGEVLVNNKPVKGPSPEIGVVFQTSNMLPWLTVEKNMMLGAQLRKLPQQQTEAKVRELVKMLGLSGFEHNHPHQLSGGMRQRASIGQILALEPGILLMDEPFGALDALTRDLLNVELLRIWQERMQTVMLITHSIQEAVFLSDRVLVMSARPGRVVHDIKIDLPRPRLPENIKGNPRYGQYIAEISKIMGVF